MNYLPVDLDAPTLLRASRPKQSFRASMAKSTLKISPASRAPYKAGIDWLLTTTSIGTCTGTQFIFLIECYIPLSVYMELFILSVLNIYTFKYHKIFLMPFGDSNSYW